MTLKPMAQSPTLAGVVCTWQFGKRMWGACLAFWDAIFVRAGGLAILALVGYDVYMAHHKGTAAALTSVHIFVLVVAAAMLFGEDRFKQFLTRLTLGGAFTGAANVARTVTTTLDKAAAKRRDPVQGIEETGKVPQVHGD